MLKQITPFEPIFHLNQKAETLRRLEDGRWQVTTSAGVVLEAPTALIAAGVGSFLPRRLASVQRSS